MSDNKRLNIKEWAMGDRPREKMLTYGPRMLSDAELIAVLIGSGNLGETAVELSRKILGSVGNSLTDLGKKNYEYLSTFKGIGEAKAVNIMAAMELSRRRKSEEMPERPQISSSRDVAEILMPLLGDLDHEEFWIMLLNRSNKVIHQFMTSKGGLTATVIDVRTILKTAIERLATAMILSHNHPSGNLTPSDADMQITRKLKEAGKIMDIQVLDHVIVSQKGYYSFADNGLL